MEYDDIFQFMFGVEILGDGKEKPPIGEKYTIEYDSPHAEDPVSVSGTLRSHDTEFAVLVADDCDYSICGYGLADREPGEVIREGDGYRRRVGHFKRARES